MERKIIPMAFFGPAPFGSLLAGALARSIGAPHTVIVTGALCLVGSLWFTLELPNVRAVMRPPRKLAHGFDIGSAVPPAQRFQWVNADGESPFPGPAAKVVDWLKHFEPKDGKSFVYADYPDECPSGGLRLLQPSVAANEHP